ncbi:MAG TPA: polysaccharide biosynthesis tyrosine autokinase [Bacteroidota bacterium]|nr:polysaccharide biosynthesis tyrosine autokinase [Bacteroidota bacterium]
MNSYREPQSNDKGNGRHQADSLVSPLWEYLAILLRGKWIILVSVCVATGLAFLYSNDTKPKFEASSLVLIETKASDKANPMLDLTGATAATKISNEIEILKSRSTIQAVAEALLSQKYINDKKTKIIPILRSAGGRDSLATVEEVSERLEGAVDFSPIHETDIVKITAVSGDPVEAALIANVYTEIYTTQNLQASRLRTTAIREFLQSQLESRKALLDSAENNLQDYMRSSGVVSLDAEGTKVVDQLTALEAQRDAIEVEKSSRLKTLASYKEEFEKLGQSSARAIEESNDSYIALLQEQIAKLEVQRDIVTAQNPGVADQKLYSDKLKEIDQQIASLKKTLAGRTDQFLKSVLPGTGGTSGGGSGSFLAEAKQRIIEQSIELQALDARKSALDGVIQDYEKKFNQIPKKSMDLARLQRAKMSNEKLYLLVEEKYNETSIQEKSEFGYVNIVDPAVVPLTPVGTRLRVYLIFGFVVGLTLGVFVTFVWAFADVRIRTPEDLKRHGFVPLSTISRMNYEIKRIVEDTRDSTAQSPLDIHLVSFYRPFGPIAESYRHLRTNVLATQQDNFPRCIMMTSAIPGEGKTTTACNLAISLAQADKKILLVNGDLRRPTIHEFFGLTNERGLAGFLSGEAGLEDVRQRGVLENLDIIASGELPDNPSELLGSNKMKEFIGMMKQEYDIILADAPPLLAVTDAAVLAKEAEGVVIVASAGMTRANALMSAVELLHSFDARLLGVVLNNFDIRSSFGSYAYGHPNGYYGYESGYYGSNGKRKKSKKRTNRPLESHT